MPLPELIKISRKVLSRFFGSDIHNTLVDEKNGSFTLTKLFSQFETSDLKGTYTLWDFPVKEELNETWVRYPIYFAFRITLKANDEIADLNIKLFKEDNRRVTNSSTRPTELLLRVEWSNEPQIDITGRKHAQPHWHIHSYTIVDKLEGRNPQDRKTILEILDEEEIQPKPFSLLDDMEEAVVEEPIAQNILIAGRKKEIPSFKFHLAMLAEWEKPTESRHDKELTNAHLELWLPKCLIYIKDQIEYILEKMGAN
jgi:hypothetical protein